MLIEFRWAKGEQIRVLYFRRTWQKPRDCQPARDVGTGGLITSIVGKFKTAPESYGPRCGAFSSGR
jgi:hypothetical protein